MKKATLYEVIPELFENNNNHEIRCLKNVELRDLNIRNLHEIGLDILIKEYGRYAKMPALNIISKSWEILTEKAISRNLEIF